jgi:hypothetical protein
VAETTPAYEAGEWIADNVTDPLLDTGIGQSLTETYYEWFLQ